MQNTTTAVHVPPNIDVTSPKRRDHIDGPSGKTPALGSPIQQAPTIPPRPSQRQRVQHMIIRIDVKASLLPGHRDIVVVSERLVNGERLRRRAADIQQQHSRKNDPQRRQHGPPDIQFKTVT